MDYNESTKIAGSEDFDVFLAEKYINQNEPIPAIYFVGAEEPLLFYQTRETLADLDRYKSFIDNCIHRFRKSRDYKGYKAYLMSLGLDRCQINGNIQDGMADIEMHHNFLTIFDITILISQHLLNTVGKCTTFDVISLLAQEHRNNNIPIVMLSETAHQMFHDNPDFYIPISMTFGKWWDLLIKYRYGITLDIAYKVVKYIKMCQKNNELLDSQFIGFSNEIQSWGNYNNEYSIGMYPNSNGDPYWNHGGVTVELNTFNWGAQQQNYPTEPGYNQFSFDQQIYGTGFQGINELASVTSPGGMANIQYQY